MEIIGTQEEILQDVGIKEARLRAFMAEQGLDAVVINRQDMFSWLTAGGDSHVLSNTEGGFATLVITPTRKWLVAHTIDALRFMEEQVAGQGYELLSLYWHDGMPMDRVRDLVQGLRWAADVPLPSVRLLGAELFALQFPLTDLDLKRARWVGRTTHRLLAEVGHAIEPGLAEVDIAAMIQERFTREGFALDVLIVGVDERVTRYRHPMPTGKRLERYALIHPGARRWGLHANVTRLVHFGEPPEAIRRAAEAVQIISGRVFGMMAPGVRFADILAEQKKWYAGLGYADEWHFHFQGGTTGFYLGDTSLSLNPAARLVCRQAYDYFVTITGAKAEDLALLTEEGVEVASSGEDWPMRVVETPGGDFQVPAMLVR